MAHAQHAQINGDRGKLPWHAPKCTELSLDELTEAERDVQALLVLLGHNRPPGDGSPSPEQDAEATAWEGAAAPLTARERFDAIVAQNLKGLYLAQRDMLLRAVPDQRLQPRHRRVLAAITWAMNKDKGTAFPGYDHLAKLTGYSPGSIRVTIAELKGFGYLAYAKYAPEPGKKAMAHYTTIKPTGEAIFASIAGKTGEAELNAQDIEVSESDRDIEVSRPDLKAHEIEVSPKLNPLDVEVRPPTSKADLNAHPPLTSMPTNYTVTGREGTGRKEDDDSDARARETVVGGVLPAVIVKGRLPAIAEIDGGYIERLHQAMLQWSPDAFGLRASYSIDWTARELQKSIDDAWLQYGPEVIVRAAALAINTIEREAGKKASAGKKEPPRTPESFFSYFGSVLETKLRSTFKSMHEQRADVAATEIRLEGLADRQLPRRRNGCAAAAARSADPIAEAVERGVDPVVVEKFCRPVLMQFPNTKNPSGWCAMIAETLADLLADKSPEDAEQVLMWAVRSIRNDCPERFVPVPNVIREGIEGYFKRKAELGEEFTDKVVFPSWDPESRRKRQKWHLVQLEREIVASPAVSRSSAANTQ